MTEEHDAKRWLHGALTDEPPLRLDRDAVLREGRRKLRNRKLFQTGGAVTGVVAAAVGAVLMSGLVTEEPSLPPASSGSHEKPPVSSSPTPAEEQAHPSSQEQAPPPPYNVDRRSSRMTAAIRESGLLPEGAALIALPGATNEPSFAVVHDGVYRLEADLKSQRNEGWLSILVETAGSNGGLGATCDIPVTEFDQCTVRTVHGVPMTVAVQNRPNGEVRNWVRAVRPDGAFVTVISSNQSERDRADGKDSTNEVPPPMSQSDLVALAALPDLGPT